MSYDREEVLPEADRSIRDCAWIDLLYALTRSDALAMACDAEAKRLGVSLGRFASIAAARIEAGDSELDALLWARMELSEGAIQ